MPEDAFRMAFGAEWFRKAGDNAPMRDGWLF